MNIQEVTDEQLEKWHDAFSLKNCPNGEIVLPNIPFTYHEIYAEIIKRAEIETCK